MSASGVRVAGERYRLVGVALLGVMAVGPVASGVEPDAGPVSARPTLRVVSSNIRHGVGMDGKLDLDRTAAVLRRLEPDLVALQEVDERCRRSGGVDQAAALGKALGMAHRFGEFMDHDGEPGSESLAVLADAGWRVLAKDGARRANPTWPADRPTQELDHVAERGLPEYSVVHDVIDEVVASDHRPILAVFTFAVRAAAAPADVLEKIGFDFDGLDADGLAGPPDGKVSISYEFRIPDTPEHRAAVQAIDPEIEIAAGPRGRVDAGPGFALCIGSTHQPRHREILLALARLPFVERIARCFFE